MISALKRLPTHNRQSKATTAASTLAKLGHEQRRATIRAKDRQMLREMGKPDDPRLA